MITLNVNGKKRPVDADPGTPLLWVLRDNLGFTSVKYTCGISECGMCTVLIDGDARQSCIVYLDEVLEIAADNTVTVWVGQTNLGQGTHTGIPMVIADELDAAWETVRVKPAPAADPFKDPVWHMQLTGGSTSIRHRWDLLRTVGAAARQMLMEAAAQQWKIPAQNWQKHPRHWSSSTNCITSPTRRWSPSTAPRMWKRTAAGSGHRPRGRPWPR